MKKVEKVQEQSHEHIEEKKLKYSEKEAHIKQTLDGIEKERQVRHKALVQK